MLGSFFSSDGLRPVENDYDSDVDQISRAQDKLRRDVRKAISDEVTKKEQFLAMQSELEGMD